MLRRIVNVLAIVAAAVSAALWFWVAHVPLDPREFATFGELPKTDQLQLIRQVRLDGYAALATGISATLQAEAHPAPGQGGAAPPRFRRSRAGDHAGLQRQPQHDSRLVP